MLIQNAGVDEARRRARWLTIDAVDPSWADALAPGEQARLAAKTTAAERARFLGAAVLMRQLLAEAARCDPAEVGLDRTCECGEPHGRPVPVGAAAGWHVNVSHSGPYVLAAVASTPVGVDVELVRPAPPSPSLLRRVLAPGEDAPQDASAFATLWSAKEAYLKAVGTGLATPMREVRVAGGTVTSLPGRFPDGSLIRLDPPSPGPAARAHLCLLEREAVRATSTR